MPSIFGNSNAGDSNTGVIGDIAKATTFNWSTRIKGFLICAGIGFAISILSCFVLSLCFIINCLTVFAVLYSIGNVVCISSTCFLMGPLKQLKKMFKPERLLATCVMLV
ncbi:SFT2 domain-containing protein 1 [Intoshia linei]|uniref:Vesicle transport protein n=1 Tax=Intoshia linei TaxID=1819745 RepID=A0A177AY58_9BILA|nr:SFT2 domain-containing protein 1 [Intoshia linei]